jgi:hypothetical protein
VVVRPGVQRDGHVGLGGAEVRGEFRPRRRPAELLGESGAGRAESEGQFLDPPGYPHRPGRVAEVPLERADDRGHGVGGEGHRPGGVVPVDRLDQAERGDLVQVFHGFTVPPVSGGQVSGQGYARLDGTVAQREAVRVAGGQVDALTQQGLHSGTAGGKHTAASDDRGNGSGNAANGGDRP